MTRRVSHSDGWVGHGLSGRGARAGHQRALGCEHVVLSRYDLTMSECIHCHKNRVHYFFCCKKSEAVLVGKSPSEKKEVAIEKKKQKLISGDTLKGVLAIMIDDGIIEAIDDSGDTRYQLTEKGELISRAIGVPPYGKA